MYILYVTLYNYEISLYPSHSRFTDLPFDWEVSLISVFCLYLCIMYRYTCTCLFC